MNNNSIFERTATYMRVSYIYHIRRYYAFLEELLIWIRVFTLFVYFFFVKKPLATTFLADKDVVYCWIYAANFQEKKNYIYFKIRICKIDSFFRQFFFHSYIYCVLFNHTLSWYDYINWEWNVTSFHLLTFNVYV